MNTNWMDLTSDSLKHYRWKVQILSALRFGSIDEAKTKEPKDTFTNSCELIRQSICFCRKMRWHTVAFWPFIRIGWKSSVEFHSSSSFSICLCRCYSLFYVRCYQSCICILAIRFALINILFARRKIMKIVNFKQKDDFNDCSPSVLLFAGGSAACKLTTVTKRQRNQPC